MKTMFGGRLIFGAAKTAGRDSENATRMKIEKK
jgi:hypothetical protein